MYQLRFAVRGSPLCFLRYRKTRHRIHGRFMEPRIVITGDSSLAYNAYLFIVLHISIRSRLFNVSIYVVLCWKNSIDADSYAKFDKNDNNYGLDE